MSRGQTPGSKVGVAISDLLARTLQQNAEASAPAQMALKDAWVKSFMERGETELAPLLRTFYAGIAEDEDAPDEVREVARIVTAPEHQWQFLVQGLALIPAIFQLAGAVAEPLITKFASSMWKATPSRRLTPENMAQALNRGVVDLGHAQRESAETGVDSNRFDILLDLVGNPPGTQELLFAFRRGIIDEARLERGIKQSDLRNEWIGMIKSLRFVPMTPMQAIQAAVESHLSMTEARKIAEQGGLLPAHFEPLFETAGRPPGIEQMAELLNRGEITVAEFDQAVRESDVKTKYIEQMRALRVYRPPPESVGIMMREGAISASTATRWWKDFGLSDDAIRAYSVRYKSEKKETQEAKNLASSQVVQLYLDREIERSKAVAMLVDLGYDATEADLILDIADHRRERQFTERAISTVRSRYIGYRIERTQASKAMDSLGIPAAQRDDLIRLWDLEREVNQKDLTDAQVAAAWLRGLIDDGAAIARLQSQGMSQADAELLLAIVATPAPQRPPPVRMLTQAQIIRAYKLGQLSEPDARDRLVVLGYSDEDASLLLATNPPTGPAA